LRAVLRLITGLPHRPRPQRDSNPRTSKGPLAFPLTALNLIRFVCQRCGYAFYRTSTRTSKRKLTDYRCLGSDAYRHLPGRLCDNRPVRQDALDEVVWQQILRLLEDPTLIRAEIDRRLQALQNSAPRQRQEAALHRESRRLGKSIERLLEAYQEGLMSLEELRQRMPDLYRREQALQVELRSLADPAEDQQAYLHLANTVEDFLARLRTAAPTLSVTDRQQVLRLLVKEILVDRETLTIRHSIPVTGSGSTSERSESPQQMPGYLLRSRSQDAALGYAFRCREKSRKNSRLRGFPLPVAGLACATPGERALPCRECSMGVVCRFSSEYRAVSAVLDASLSSAQGFQPPCTWPLDCPRFPGLCPASVYRNFL
jgi:hypothetical protein